MTTTAISSAPVSKIGKFQTPHTVALAGMTVKLGAHALDALKSAGHVQKLTSKYHPRAGRSDAVAAFIAGRQRVTADPGTIGYQNEAAYRFI